jgi:transcriptional regulator with XRE-family HTH domain
MDRIISAVRKLRQELGDSQQRFANRLGLSIRAIANYEKDRRPTGVALVRLARAAKDAGKPELSNDFMMALMDELGLIDIPFRQMAVEHRGGRVLGLILATFEDEESIQYAFGVWDCMEDLASDVPAIRTRARKRLGDLKAAVDSDPERQLPTWAKKKT